MRRRIIESINDINNTVTIVFITSKQFLIIKKPSKYYKGQYQKKKNVYARYFI